jgi:hypothetical protein
VTQCVTFRGLKIPGWVCYAADRSGGPVGERVLRYLLHGYAAAAETDNFVIRDTRQGCAITPYLFTGTDRAEIGTTFLIVTTRHKNLYGGQD